MSLTVAAEHLNFAARELRARAGTARRADTERFSLCRAILAASAGESLRGFEAERDADLREAHKQHLTGNPGFLLAGPDLAPHLSQRDLYAASATAGGYLVETENVSYVELARPRSVAMSLGAVVLPNLKSNINLGRVSSAATAGWNSSEAAGTAASTPGFGQIALEPKSVSVTAKFSRNFLLQSTPEANRLVANELLAAIGQTIDQAAVNGTGINGQPLGIVNTPGIGTASGSTFNHSAAIDLQSAVANRLNTSAGYAAPVATAKVLAKRLKDSSNTASYVWDNGLIDGQVSGVRALVSDDVPASTMIFGAWDQLIVGQWGPMQIEVSPYGLSVSDHKAGIVAVRIIVMVDVAVRDPGAFAVATSVT